MTHTFDSEVSLHFWLLWPMVRHLSRPPNALVGSKYTLRILLQFISFILEEPSRLKLTTAFILEEDTLDLKVSVLFKNRIYTPIKTSNQKSCLSSINTKSQEVRKFDSLFLFVSFAHFCITFTFTDCLVQFLSLFSFYFNLRLILVKTQKVGLELWNKNIRCSDKPMA